MTVLHVDDNPLLTEVAATALERDLDHVEVLSASGARGALEVLARGTVDCVVSDHDMPRLNSIDFLRTVREDHPSPPFILFTGKGSEEVASESISAGVTDYLQKEGGLDQYTVLANRITNAVESYQYRRRLQRYETVLRALGDPVYAIDADGRFTFVNEALVSLTGYPEMRLLGEHASLILEPTAVEEEIETICDLLRSDDRTTGAYAMEIVSAGGERVPCEDHTALLPLGASGEFRGTAGVIRDVSERKEREHRLEALHEATHELVTASDRTAVAEIVAEATRDTLGYANTVVRLLTDDRSVLRPVAMTDRAREQFGERPVYSVGEGTAGRRSSGGTAPVRERECDRRRALARVGRRGDVPPDRRVRDD